MNKALSSQMTPGWMEMVMPPTFDNRRPSPASGFVRSALPRLRSDIRRNSIHRRLRISVLRRRPADIHDRNEMAHPHQDHHVHSHDGHSGHVHGPGGHSHTPANF